VIDTKKYFDKHWRAFLRSFRLDVLTFKLFITDILFILTIILAYDIVYAFWIKNVVSISSILGIEEGVVPAVSTIDIAGAVQSFLTTLIIIAIVIVIIYVFLISLYGAISHTFMNDKRLTLKLFLNFLSIYSLMTLSYILLTIMIFILSQNVWLIAGMVIFLTAAYIYSMLIFYLVISDKKFKQVIRHGFKSIIRVHDTLIPIFLGTLFLVISFTVIVLLLGDMVLSAVLILLSALYVLTWTRRYMHRMIHET